MDIFNNEDYKLISEVVEKKLTLLRKNVGFNKKYLNLIDAMDELETSLSKDQREKFYEIVNLFYETEAYYFAFSYSLGVKYGEDLEKL